MQSLLLSDATYKRIAAFASRIGKPASTAADEAINEWMDTHGDPIVKSVNRRCRNVVAFPYRGKGDKASNQ